LDTHFDVVLPLGNFRVHNGIFFLGTIIEK